MIEEDNKILHKQWHSNDVSAILCSHDPFKKDMKGMVVESTYNRYWLVDALMETGYVSILSTCPPSNDTKGVKQTGDKKSSLWLANVSIKIAHQSFFITSYTKEKSRVSFFSLKVIPKISFVTAPVSIGLRRFLAKSCR